MSKPDPTAIRVHEDPAMFLEAVNFTAAQTGFSPRLIEKDYFCTLLLRYLATTDMLVFKGGTCMAKVHGEFYRLSEDLDFAIPMPCDAMPSRLSRRKLKKTVAELATKRGFTVVEPLTGPTFRRSMFRSSATILFGGRPGASRSRSVCASHS